nr:hypothetical protein [Mycobacterium avium]
MITPFCSPPGTSARPTRGSTTILIVRLSPVSWQLAIPSGPLAQ